MDVTEPENSGTPGEGLGRGVRRDPAPASTPASSLPSVDTPGGKPCVFCQIVAGDVSADVVWRGDGVVAFLDRSPLFYGHTLVVPERHVPTLTDLGEDFLGTFFAAVQRIAAVMPEALNVQGTFVANNNIVSQSVPHLHVHVVPRVKGDGLKGFFWPRQRPDSERSAAAAAALREALR